MILWHSSFFIVQLSHPYMSTGKLIALTIWTFVGKVMSLLFNTLSRFVIDFLPRSRHFLVLFSHLFAMKWWDRIPWSSFFDCWVLSQPFHSPLSPLSRGSLISLHFLLLSPCCPRDSQESSPAPQFESINSFVPNLLYGLNLTSIHDFWKNYSFDYMDLCRQSNVSAF